MTAQAQKLDLAKVRKIVGMMGSEHVGERASAALLFTQALRTAGVSHEHLELHDSGKQTFRRETGDETADRILRQLQREKDTKARHQREVALLQYEIEVLRSFVSGMVHHQITSAVEDEARRLREGGAIREPGQTGGWPSWKKSKAKWANPQPKAGG